MSTCRDIVFLDTETPNRRNDSICAFGGFRITPDSTLASRVYSLVDPEAEFTFDNIAVHGIQPQDVSGKPNFAELWDAELRDFLRDADIVAHGAVFDLTVLAKTFKRYRCALPAVRFVDTRALSRRYIPEIPHHRLENVAEFLGFEFEQHNARSDAECCMRVFFWLEEQGYFSRTDEDLWQIFDFKSEADKFAIPNGMLKMGLGRSNIVDKLPDIVERSAQNVELDGAVVCLTGDFEISPLSIDPVVSYIEDMGAIHSKNMTLSVDYLIVGNLGSPRWKHGNYGNKIATAMRWVEEGKSHVRIIDEASLPSGKFLF